MQKPLITIVEFGFAALVIALVALYFLKGSGPTYDSAVVSRGDITETVTASGKVESPTTVNLHFKSAGRLVSLSASTGKKVSAGDTLARQDSRALSAQLSQMQAGIDISKATLAKLTAGASMQDIALAKTALTNAKSARDNAVINLVDMLRNAYTTADDAVRNKGDQLFNNPRTSDPKLIFLTSDNQLQIAIESGRITMEAMLIAWQGNLKSLSADTDMTIFAYNTSQSLNQTKLFLDNLAAAVNAIVPSSNISQTTIDKWKTDISTARTNVNTAIGAVTTANNSRIDKEGALQSAEAELTRTTAPARAEDIALSEAQIKQAEAQAAAIEAQIADTVITAPISGTVTDTNGEVGEIITPETMVVSVIPESALQVKLNVSENDIAKVALGQSANIVLDAFPGEVRTGRVIAIDPAETLVGGAVYYKTTIVLNEKDLRVKPGMTTDVSIETAVKQGVLLVPASALTQRGGAYFVQIFMSGKPVETEVKPGVRSKAGMVEILSGLREGNTVIIGTKQ